jgi:hypothetical protein
VVLETCDRWRIVIKQTWIASRRRARLEGSQRVKHLGRSQIDVRREPCSPIAPIRVVIIVHDSQDRMLVYFRAKLVAGLFVTRLLADHGRAMNTSEDKLRIV